MPPILYHEPTALCARTDRHAYATCAEWNKPATQCTCYCPAGATVVFHGPRCPDFKGIYTRTV